MQRISGALRTTHSIYDRGQEYAVAHPMEMYQTLGNVINTLEGESQAWETYHRRQQ